MAGCPPRGRWHRCRRQRGEHASAQVLPAVATGACPNGYSAIAICSQFFSQYATVHIDAQILVLRDFIASLQNPGLPSSSRSSSLSVSAHSPLAEHHLQTLTNIRRDVVETIRQVVDVVSKYAGGALPEPAKARVRQFILCLPQRWAQAASGPLVAPSAGGVGSPDLSGSTKKEAGRGRGRASAPYSYGPGEAGPSPRSRPASRATSPASLRSHGPSRTASGIAALPTMGAATNAAQKILTLATESLDMLRAVTGVFKDSLDKADAQVSSSHARDTLMLTSRCSDGSNASASSVCSARPPQPWPLEASRH